MKPWPKMIALLVTTGSIAGGMRAECIYGLVSQQPQDPRSANARNEDRRKQERKSNKKPEMTVDPQGRSLAFDVAAADHRRTKKYVLEIKHSSGVLRQHDLRKPKLRLGTITVPLPALSAGEYELVVVAHGKSGIVKSAPIKVQFR